MASFNARSKRWVDIREQKVSALREATDPMPPRSPLAERPPGPDMSLPEGACCNYSLPSMVFLKFCRVFGECLRMFAEGAAIGIE